MRYIVRFSAFALALLLAGCGTVQTVGNSSGKAARQTANGSARGAGTGLTSLTQPPVEVMSFPGALYSASAWPFQGSTPQNTGTPASGINFTAGGVTIAGVHWTWPSSDRTAGHYLIVPTVIRNRPYLVWGHLAAQKYAGKPMDGKAYAPSQLLPEGPSQLYLTPWNRRGGPLEKHATVLTSDIPPVWSLSGQSVFPADSRAKTPAALAGSAWTGWFHWGRVARPFTAAKPQKGAGAHPTVAVLQSLYSAYNGVVLVIGTHVLEANQGQASNVYYLDLARHRIVGLGSLTGGGGLFSNVRVVSGMVLTVSATDLTPKGNTLSAQFAYNEYTGTRQTLPRSVQANMISMLSSWTFRGGRIYNSAGKMVARVPVPAQALYEPSAAAFGVSGRTPAHHAR